MRRTESSCMFTLRSWTRYFVYPHPWELSGLRLGDRTGQFYEPPPPANPVTRRILLRVSTGTCGSSVMLKCIRDRVDRGPSSNTAGSSVPNPRVYCTCQPSPKENGQMVWPSVTPHHTSMENQYLKFASTTSCVFTSDHKCDILVLLTRSKVIWASSANKMYWYMWGCATNQWQCSNHLPKSPGSRFECIGDGAVMWGTLSRVVVHRVSIHGLRCTIPSNVLLVFHISPHSTFCWRQHNEKRPSF